MIRVQHVDCGVRLHDHQGGHLPGDTVVRPFGYGWRLHRHQGEQRHPLHGQLFYHRSGWGLRPELRLMSSQVPVAHSSRPIRTWMTGSTGSRCRAKTRPRTMPSITITWWASSLTAPPARTSLILMPMTTQCTASYSGGKGNQVNELRYRRQHGNRGLYRLPRRATRGTKCAGVKSSSENRIYDFTSEHNGDAGILSTLATKGMCSQI